MVGLEALSFERAHVLARVHEHVCVYERLIVARDSITAWPRGQCVPGMEAVER